MFADALRHFYAYHFRANRMIWNALVMPLPMELYLQDSDYSKGSVRNQLVHLMEVEQGWFSQIRGVNPPEFHDNAYYDTKEKLRSAWDTVEADIQAFLNSLTDDMLANIVPDDDADDLPMWQVMLHVVNHGTDHRAQVLQLLNRLGVKTYPQDYIFYIMGEF